MENSQPNPNLPQDEGATVRAPGPEVVFNRYDLLSELGKGGMGVVWLARDRELNSKVALKFLRDEMTSEGGALKELKSEVLINRDLAHPNIIKTFDFVTDSRRSAISMEFVDGTNLHKLKSEQKGKLFDAETISPWILQLCDAVHYAHSQKVVHRDIKPANLMVNDRGEMKLGDFGIGRTVADTVNRVTRNAAGTPPFMSPQQTMGEKSAPSDDIYSIGATIYDLLTSEPPFFRGAIREQALGKVPPSMTERRKELGVTGGPIPESWEKAVAAALAKDPVARPATARALKDILEGKGAAPKAGGKKTPMLVGAAVAVVALGAGGYFFMKQGPAAAPTPTQAPTAGATTAPPTANPSAPATQTQTVAPSVVTPAASVVNSTAPATVPSSGPATVGLGAPALTFQIVQPATGAPAQAAPVSVPTNTPTLFDQLVQSGRITAAESTQLKTAIQGSLGDFEQKLAARMIDPNNPLSTADWHLFSAFVATTDETVLALRPMLSLGVAKGGIDEKEFKWLFDSIARKHGDTEQANAAQVLAKTLPLDSWRTQTDCWPERKLDPQMVKIKPLLDQGKLTKEEGDWLHDALAGTKSPEENTLAANLIDAKTITPGQWRAKTSFSYALPADAKIDPAKLPTALDLALAPTVSLRLLRIEPGTFNHGSPTGEVGRLQSDQTQAEVKITQPYFIGIYEVTQTQFESVMGGRGKNPSYFRPIGGRKSENWPVEQVSWKTAADFISTLNGSLAGKYGGALIATLPTEDEWEYACRAGTTSAFNNGKSLANATNTQAAGLNLLANFGHLDGGTPMPVGSFQPNAWGLYDMHGNVMEWTQNLYQHGGHWGSTPTTIRSASRVPGSAEAQGSDKVGIRLVVRLKPAAPAPAAK